MKHLAAALLVVLFASGCNRDGAVRVTVHYENFEPGCLEVSAADSKGGEPAALQFANDKLSGGNSVMVGVERKPGWSTKLTLRVRSFERGCEGTAVEDQTTDLTLQPGTVSDWDVVLAARDADGDGYAGATGSVHGSDCDDTTPLRSPSATEECGASDTNCNGLIGCADPACVGHACDDGLAITTADVCLAGGGCAGRAASDCAPGTFVTQMPTGTMDRVCTACPPGSFSGSVNAANCSIWNDCLAGQRVATPPSPTSDRGCVACDPGTYSSVPNSTGCAPIGSCAPGTVQIGPPNMGGPVQCMACTAGTYCAGGSAPSVPCATGTWDDDGNPASACVAWTSCAVGFEVTGMGTATTNLVCTPCAVGNYCAGGLTSAVPCMTGSWDHDANPSTTCVAWSECAVGSALTTAGTTTTNNVCTPCAAGNYCAGQNSPAVPCAGGTWDHDANAATACTAWADCAVGQSISVAGTTTANRQCANCAAGSYTTVINAPSCTTWTPCTVGQFVSTAGTMTSNQACSLCASGTFSASQNATSCTTWSTCSADTYESVAPTASNDRVCANYSSCLDRLTRVPSTPNGSYVIDPDGPGPASSFNVTCDMTTSGGGWTLVSFEDFSSSATGWTDTRRDTTSSCFTAYGPMLGGYNQFGSGVTDSKTYDLLGITHTQVRVTLDYYVIDSWDNESARVSVDGTSIFNQAFTMGGTNTCGGAFADRGLQAVAGTVAHTTNSTTLTVTSTLNQAANDESFGVDNVRVFVR